MRVEILHNADCANWKEAGVRLRAVLDEAGMPDVTIDFHLLTTPAEAASVPFAGSPTILFDGADAFPGAARVTELACRVYRTENGFVGAPSAEQLSEAVRKHLQT
ncbi:hypothetical protein [Homoserinimonas sp. OAct 916]|uniref:hypothetical protein n=1 Tax=Homoserinimonas sp. OAct 916 TaxID=2211450 RepID=UPI000DBE2F54|nr:hypothetical protein [Homoserinimonas sp. OAct 916]